MQIAKWGDSLAVLLSSEFVKEKGLSEGDEVDFVDLRKTTRISEKADPKAEFVKAMDQFRWPASADYKFDREEANER